VFERLGHGAAARRAAAAAAIADSGVKSADIQEVIFGCGCLPDSAKRRRRHAALGAGVPTGTRTDPRFNKMCAPASRAIRLARSACGPATSTLRLQAGLESMTKTLLI